MRRIKKFTYSKYFKKYCGDLSKKSVSPGGGSAGSAMCCIGVSLIQMAIQFSLRSNKKQLIAAYKKLDSLKSKPLSYIDGDAQLFMKVMSANNSSRRKLLAKKLNAITFALGKNCITIVTVAGNIQKYIKKSIRSDFDIGLALVGVALFSSIKNMQANSSFFGVGAESQLKYLKNYLKGYPWPKF